jgi:hypothetical protein
LVRLLRGTGGDPMTFAERVQRYESSLDAELGAGWDAEKAMLAAGEADEPECDWSRGQALATYNLGCYLERFNMFLTDDHETSR